MVNHNQSCTICAVSPVVARGWCNSHYQRYKKYGDPNKVAFSRTKLEVGSAEYFEECTVKTDGPLETQCWLWNKAIDKAGYGRFGSGSLYSHRESYKLFIGAIPEGMLVCHKCDIRTCVNPEHLFLGTYDDNNQDMIAKKRDRKARKLSDDDVSTIRELWKTGEHSQPEISSLFDISPSMVSAIVTNKRRKPQND